MFTRYFVTILLIVFSFNSFAQGIKLTGKVTNDKSEPLPGVTIKASGLGSTTDVDGNYSLNLASGKKYILTFSAVGYAAKTVSDIEAVAGSANELNIVLSVSATDLGGVVVTANTRNARKESVNALIAFQKNTNTVAQVISAESIRRSPDRNTGEALKRIPGTSIQDGKYLIVRGLSDRYNQAMLNGILLASTEPDRKTFSFDLFPAAMIDNIIVNKAFVPELPGEWAGGLVQVNTKDIPSKGFLNVQVGTGFNTQTIGKDFYRYKGGKLDWLGIDDGTRSLPTAVPVRTKYEKLSADNKTDYVQQFSNTWAAEKGTAPLNAAFQMSGGFNTRVLDKKVGGIMAVNYNKSNRRLNFGNRFYTGFGVDPTPIYEYNNERYAQDVMWGVLGNVSVQLNNNNKISFKNLFNVNGSDYATLRTGKDYENGTPVYGDNIKAQELGFRSTIYYNTQLIGEHNISSIKTRFKWYGGFTLLDQQIPDQRRIQYNQPGNDPSAPYSLLISGTLSQKSGNRFFSSLSDYIYNAGGDVSKSFQWLGYNQTIKTGYMLQVRDRIFDARPFSAYLQRDNEQLRQLSPDVVFSPSNFGAPNSGLFEFDQLNNKKYHYMGNTILNAGYLQFDNQFSNVVRFVWGARVEHYDQLVGDVHTSDERHTYSKVLDVLPGANLTLKLNNKTNIRVSGSQTVIRPELRELAAFQYYDFELNASVKGSPYLKRTKITNADIRYEMYPRAGEMFTVGLFYKHFKNPIELQFQPGAGGSSAFDFLNAEQANAYGIELEARKKLDFTPALKNLTVFGNLSYIRNRVQDTVLLINRPMQGQSPYLINIGMQYDIESAGLNTSLLFNQIGRRIIYVGGSEVPVVWESPRPLLDFQIAKKILNKKGEIKLNVSDILGQFNYLYYDTDDNEKFSKNRDEVFISRRYGTTFGLSFAYNIK